MTYTSRAHCSTCDADVGTGKSDGSLCESFCQDWMFACKNAYFDPYLEAPEEVPFCREDSLICSPVLSIADSPEKFCEMMGFKMAPESKSKGRRSLDSKRRLPGQNASDNEEEEDVEEDDDIITKM